MTIHQPNNPHPQPAGSIADNAHPDSSQPRKLAVDNPFIYFFILFGVLIRPDKLKAYRMRLNPTERLHFKKQASRLVATFAWLPLLSAFILILVNNNIGMESETAVFFLFFCLIAAYHSFRLEINPSADKSNHLLLGSMFSIFGLVAVLTVALYTNGENGYLSLMLALGALMCSLIGLCIAMVFNLQTLDTICGFVGICLVGSICMSLNQVLTTIWFPVLAMVGSLLWVGIVEERHDLNPDRR